MQRLVDAHRLERADVPLVRDHVSLGALVERVVRRLAPIKRERGIQIDVTGGGDA